MQTLSSASSMVAIARPPARPWRRPPASTHLKFSVSAVSTANNETIAPATGQRAKKVSEPDADVSVYKSITSSASLPVSGVKALNFRPSPELGLLSILFVFSMAIASVLSLAVISLPTMNALKRLATSIDDLSKVASVEVPGTLSSLKLSSLEINELTQQLRNLRQIISGRHGKRERGRKSGSTGRKSDPTID